MLSKISSILAMILALAFLVGKSADVPTLIFRPVLRVVDYTAFSDLFKTAAIGIGLLLLLVVFTLAGEAGPEPKPASWLNWAIGFGLTLGLAAGLVAYANPEGRYPWNQSHLYITVAARPVKAIIYKTRTSTPQVVMFGSSVSFTSPAGYFKENWGLDAFNMSLNGGGPVDFVDMLNFMIAKSPDHKSPLVLTAELLGPSLKTSNPAQTSLDITPYMAPDQAAAAWQAAGAQLISISSVSDSLFTLIYVETGRWIAWLTFDPDGSGVVHGGHPSEQIYQAGVKNDAALERGLLTCQTLDPLGKEYVEKLIDLSKQYRFSIVFYRPPVNADFYTVTKTTPKTFAGCSDALNAYMETLTTKNPNVFYQDLSADPSISTLGSSVYIDTHHLYANGNTMVLEALQPTFETALAWAQANHK